MISVFVGGIDFTSVASNITYSTVDPGGYEACSFSVPGYLDPPAVGTRILITEGLQVAWEGMVEDPGTSFVTDSIQGVGYGALLKDSPYAIVYVDAAIADWNTDAPVNEKVRLQAASFDFGQLSFGADNQGLDCAFPAGSALPANVVAEAWLKAPSGSKFSKVSYRAIVNGLPTGWVVQVGGADNDSLAAATESTSATADDAVHSFTYGSSRNYAYVLVSSQGNAATPAAGANFIFKKIAVFGNHGLTTRTQTGEPDGLLPVDIALHALSQVTTIVQGQIDFDSTGYIAPNSVYVTPVVPEQVIDDMARLLGWHWGVWESQSILTTPPRLDFCKRPSSPTCWVSRRSCDNLTITEKRSVMYDTCVVTYTDADGIPQEVSVQITNLRLPSSRTLQLDGGVNNVTGATNIATAALLLAQASQRGGGSPTMPPHVMTASGPKPSHLLKAGIDRLRIIDLPNVGSTLDPTNQFDTFRIQRTEVSYTNGRPVTTVEIDSGADLLEVLQARLASAAAAHGIG